MRPTGTEQAYMEKMANWGCLRYTKSSPNTRKVFKHIRRIRRKNLCAHGEDAKRLLTYSPNTPKDISFLKILSNYTMWNGLSQQTISRYCPFNPVAQVGCFIHLSFHPLSQLCFLSTLLSCYSIMQPHSILYQSMLFIQQLFHPATQTSCFV